MTTLTPETLALLKRVYATLNNTYFDRQGRYCHRIPTTFTAAEIKSLDDARLTPNTFVKLAHDDAISSLRASARAIDLRRAADAFAASLTTADPAWQAVLPATALGLAIPAHAYQGPMGSEDRCRICYHCDEAHDTTLHAYFSHIQGTGFSDINDGPVGAFLTLERARAIPPAGWPAPAPRDIWVFHLILDIIRAQPPATRYGKIRELLKKSTLLSRGNQYRCETFLEALAHLGILETPARPGFFTRFTPAAERDQRPNTRVEVPAPLAWWQASDGINEKLLARLFGHLEKKRPATEPPAPIAAKPPRRKTPAATVAPRLPKRLPGPPAAGDVYAIRYREDLWGAAYCHEVHTDTNGTTRGLIEYLDLLAPAPPDAETLATVKLRYRDRHDGGRWQAWVSRLDADTGVRRIAKNIPPPAHKKPLPDRIPAAGAPELRHLARWHFREL